MASSSAVSPQFKLIGCRSEFSVDCSQQNHRKTCPRKSLSLSKSWQDSGRLLWSGQCKNWQLYKGRAGLPVRAVLGRETPDDENDPNDPEDDSTSSNDSNNINSDIFREKMERMLDSDDAAFGGKDLATLIRKKYGRSYDVQFIKKEFMGRQLLAMNVMWKYREQRSFPLTEEEYLLHLDWIASTLKNWGAVSYVRSALAGTKEKPRIGKAVSIFIDLDEFGGRAKEWIKR